ncbi:MAG: F0F1 ATP synthase subunit gamma [Stappia sp.]|uniref:F0F1 ATP synthase subunit gamma n=1 Tax=Stappia sp. TaxID=1870903 RepID=UPI000C58E6BC|nr:F0F1 ATP synthase subunit gamma [Stappia sp.]MAA98054.1 F0F1 ATP synthase subunit gamma [Stappia sp.]MBM19365.1 F0F1 ATP synthase subunit gamma [Stappia sp.]|tara:strand:- start:1524 stop:2405 length:882 start_codon:yes stop_codon:yes gene_type:complete
MPSLKDLRNRIASVKATQKITKAMQMVAAAKLRRAQEAAEAARPYAERMEAVLANIASGFEGRDDAPVLFAGTGKDDVHLLVVATADRGLCGGFNSSIVKLARERARSLIAQGKTVKILCVGKKGFDLLKRDMGSLIVQTVELRHVKRVAFENADEIGDIVRTMFGAGEFDVCTLFFARFNSVISQVPTAQQLIPVVFDEAAASDEGSPALYEYEPGEAEILEDLLPRNISVQIFKGLLENAASEQGARMSAMDNATRNAGEMIDKLTLSYNRQRQAQITKELIEIISGAEAL